MDTDEHHQENREIKNAAVAMKPGAKCIISNTQITFYNAFQSQHRKQKCTYTFQYVHASMLH